MSGRPGEAGLASRPSVARGCGAGPKGGAGYEQNLEGHAGARPGAPPAGDGLSRAKAAIAMVRIFGAFLVVVGLALLAASVLQGIGGN
jgi:hypothetical protein